MIKSSVKQPGDFLFKIYNDYWNHVDFKDFDENYYNVIIANNDNVRICFKVKVAKGYVDGSEYRGKTVYGRYCDWYIINDEGYIHCEDGPASTTLSGMKLKFFLNGIQYSFGHWCEILGKSDEEIIFLKLKYNEQWA